MIDPLRITFDVPGSPQQTFELWTEQTSAWWPKTHTVSAASELEVVIEPGVGGRIYERTGSGVEHDWGQVVRWEPPRRLVYLWHLRQDRADATEVEITFAAAGDNATTVSIEHRGWERLGARGPERREANQHGWSGLVPRFEAAARGRAAGVSSPGSQ